MVATAVGLIVMSAVIAVYSTTSRNSAALTNAAQQLQNGNYAIRFLAEDLRHAGYYGGAYATMPAPGALPDPCVTGNLPVLQAALALPVQGYDAPGAPPVSCIPATDFVPGTDVLVVRRASTVATAPASLTAQDLYLQNNDDWTNAGNPILNTGLAAKFTLLKRDGVTLADIRKYYVRIYYVSPCHLYAPAAANCDAAADAGQPVPTLKMLELGVAGGGTQMNSIALAEGVENLQVDYGVDAAGQGAAQNFVTAPATPADWANVTEIKLNLLVRNPQQTIGYTDAKTYTLGLAGAVSPGGNFKRHLFTEHVRLTNVAELRESP
jgi:type IV pilus assembly protein PilW